MVSFVKFARIASISVSFHLGTLPGYFFSLRLLAKFEFPARISNKTCLKCLEITENQARNKQRGSKRTSTHKNALVPSIRIRDLT